MRNRSLTLAGGLLLAIAPALYGQSRPSDEAGLTRLRQAYLSAYNSGDVAAMQPLYVEEAIRMPYGAPEQVGREAILSYYRNSFASRRFDPELRFEVNEVRLLREGALERGHYMETLRPRDGGQTLLERGKYVTLARRMPDGSWRYEWSIFNRDAPAEPIGG